MSFFKRYHVVTKDGKDTGMRSTWRGRLYVDREVFFKRPEVIEKIEQVRKSYEERNRKF